MRILAHRGYWQTPAEKNTRAAFQRAIAGTFGIETDVRDHNGTLVIAHDKPMGNEIELREFLSLVPSGAESAMLAINIKADGLARDIGQQMASMSALNWFAFDMSVPDMLSYFRAQLPVFTRISDLEPEPIGYQQSVGLWVDGFARDWVDFDRLRRFLDDGKMIAIVSSELHGRAQDMFWENLRNSMLWQQPGFFLCTDLPTEAQSFFA